MKSDDQRGEFGAWLRRARSERFKSVPIAVKALRGEAGYGIAPSVWAELESGTRRPSQEQHDRLTTFFGSVPEVAQSTDLVAAIREQTVAIREQGTAIASLADAIREQNQPARTPAAVGNPWPVIIRLALAAKGMAPGSLAVRTGSNTRSVERWLSGEGTPSLKEQRGIFTVLAESAVEEVQPGRRRKTA